MPPTSQPDFSVSPEHVVLPIALFHRMAKCYYGIAPREWQDSLSHQKEIGQNLGIAPNPEPEAPPTPPPFVPPAGTSVPPRGPRLIPKGVGARNTPRSPVSSNNPPGVSDAPPNSAPSDE